MARKFEDVEDPKELLPHDHVTKRLGETPGFKDGQNRRRKILKLGRRLRDLRETALQISQTEAAKLACMEQPELSRIENGLGERGPSYDTITRIIDAYQSFLRERDPSCLLELQLSVRRAQDKVGSSQSEADSNEVDTDSVLAGGVGS